MLGKRTRKPTVFINATLEAVYHDPAIDASLAKLTKFWHYPGKNNSYSGSFERVEWKQRCNTCIIDKAEVLLGLDARDMDVIYLDGPDVCSTKCFIAMGVLPENMFAVSSQSGVGDAVKAVNNKIKFSSKDFLRVSKKYRYAFDVLYIDLCCTWRYAKCIVKAAFDISKPNSIFAFSVCRRDKDKVSIQGVDDAMREMGRKYPIKFKMKLQKTIKTSSGYFVFIYHFS